MKLFKQLVLSSLIGVATIASAQNVKAAAITQQGNPYVCRTSFMQSTGMPKIANYIKDKWTDLHRCMGI